MQHHSKSRAFSAAASWLLTVAVGVSTLLAAAPRAWGDPRIPDAKRLPEKGLVAYLEYDGLGAHAKAWEGTAASAIIDRTPTGAMAAELARQVLNPVLKSAEAKVNSAELLALLHGAVNDGFTFAIYDRGEGSSCCVLVGHGFGRQDARRRLEELRRGLLGVGEDAKPSPAVKIRGRDVYQAALSGGDDDAGEAAEALAPPRAAVEVAPVRVVAVGGAEKAEKKPASEPTQSIWFEGDDLFLVQSSVAAVENVPEDVADPKAKPKGATPSKHRNDLDAIFDAIEGKAPLASAHPGYVAALAEGKDIDAFEPDGLFFVDPNGKEGLFKSLFEALPGAGPLGGGTALSGLSLPSAKYMHDDVQYFPPGPTLSSVAVTSGPKSGAVPAALPPGGHTHQDVPSVPPRPAAPRAVEPPAVNYEPVPTAGPTPIADPHLRTVAIAPKISTLNDVPGPAAPRVVGSPAANYDPVPTAGPTPVPASILRTAAITPKPDDVKAKTKEVEDKDEPKEIDGAAILGLDGIKRVIVRWGFQGKGLLTDVRVDVPAPRKGLMKLLDQPGFRKDRLPPIPREVSSFVIGSFDPAQTYEAIVSLAKTANPEVGAMVDAAEKAAVDATGLRLREDLFAHIGPTWCTFDVADRPTDWSKGVSPGQVIVAAVRDADAFAKVLDTAATQVNAYLRKRENGDDNEKGGKQDADLPMLALERLPAPARGYQLTSPAGLVVWLDDEIRPTILVGKSYVVFAANPDVARAVLAAETAANRRWRPEGELAETFAQLPAELTSLSVADTAGSAWPEAIAKLPAYVQLAGNLIESASSGAALGPGSLFVSLAGVPSAPGFRVRLSPAKLPKAAAVRAQLLPSALATTLDDRGLRWIGREAFPLAAVSGSVPIKPKFKIDLTKPVGSRLNLDFEVLGVKRN